MAELITGGPGLKTSCTPGQAHLFQEPALLTQAHLHLPNDLLQSAALFLHVSLLPAQPLLQSWGQYTGCSLTAVLPNMGVSSYREGLPRNCSSCCRIPNSRSCEEVRCEASTREDSTFKLLENFSICSMMPFRDLKDYQGISSWARPGHQAQPIPWASSTR